MKRLVHHAPLLLALLAGSHAHAKDLPNYDAHVEAAQAATSAAPSRGAGITERGFVASTDAKSGAPTFFWASRSQKARPAQLASAGPEQLARHYLEENARAYGISRAALDAAKVVHVHDTGRGGIIVVLRQSIDGIELLRNDVKVLINRQGDLVAVGGNLHPAAGSPRASRPFKLPAAAAAARAFDDLYGVQLPAAALAPRREEKAGYTYFDLGAGPAAAAAQIELTRPARAKRVFFPMPGAVVPAYYLEIQAARKGQAGSDAYGYVIAADDGRLLMRHSLTQYESFEYRVWADPSANHKIPLDGPTADFNPHPTGMPDGSVPGFTPSVLVSMEGFNTNPSGEADPWLPAGATETSGNNVDAYVDFTSPDGLGPGDFRATATSPGTFDHTYDTALEPLSSAAQSMAATTQLFYVTNWMHDWWYDSGFDEAAGNAQQSNLGRGGVEGDPLHAEAQDGALAGFRDNANMTTPADGEPPRMQMYLWSGANVHLELGVQPLNASFEPGVAGFGPRNFDLTAELVLADDGTASVTDACQPLVNDVAGKVVLVDRGSCIFKAKAMNLEAAGAAGMILANHTANQAPPTMGNGEPEATPVSIPALSITLEDGGVLKAQLQGGPVTVTMQRESLVERDGTIDNGTIAHEWGHYLHWRLTHAHTWQGSGMGEGWADFNALLMFIREGDSFEGTTYAVSQYAGASRAEAGYYGIRRLPYTTDHGKNPLTFGHIVDGATLPDMPMGTGGGNNAEWHNVGEIWASMLLEGYALLITQSGRPFDEVKRRMSDYVVAGMMMAPANPTFSEQRDALLAAALANDAGDHARLAEGFARRGLGTCADSPPRDSKNMAGAVEHFAVSARHAIVSATIDDGVRSCDSDGILDADETGRISVEIANPSGVTLTNTQATASSTTPGVSFPSGATVTFADVPPFSTGVATIEIALAEALGGAQEIDVRVDVTNGSSCVATVTATQAVRVDIDDLPASSATETVDSHAPVWEAKGLMSEHIWSRAEDASGNRQWVGAGYGVETDTSLESPDLVVSAAGGLQISFEHRYEFHTTVEDGEEIYWDGAVIEVSDDGGATWTDAAAHADPGYNGTIGVPLFLNPLLEREGFVGKNPSWPGKDTVSLDLGDAFAGKTIKIRFRIGSDESGGTPGWEIDNVAVEGLDTMPFSTVTADQATCSEPPPDGVGGSGGSGGSSGDGGGAVSGTGGGMPAPSGGEDGCGCSVPGQPSAPQGLGAIASLLAAASVALRRRRSGALR